MKSSMVGTINAIIGDTLDNVAAFGTNILASMLPLARAVHGWCRSRLLAHLSPRKRMSSVPDSTSP